MEYSDAELAELADYFGCDLDGRPIIEEDEEWAIHEIRRGTHNEPLGTWNCHRRHVGGEWDPVRAIPIRERQRLTGARFMSAGGMSPDTWAEIIYRNVAEIEDVDAAVGWLRRTGREAIAQRRRAARARRIRRLLDRHGHLTYHERRTMLVREMGYSSVWHYRQAKGWE